MSNRARTILAFTAALLIWVVPQNGIAQEEDPAPADPAEAEGEASSPPEPVEDSAPQEEQEPAPAGSEGEVAAEEAQPAAEPITPVAEDEAELEAEPEPEPYVPPADADYPEAPVEPDYAPVPLVVEEPALPFARGDMELGLGLGLAGGGEVFYLGLGGAFAYYVVNRLAPGVDLQYTKIFSDYEYPDSFRLLPFLKFVLLRNIRFSPYLIMAGGREFQWGGSSNPEKGVRETDAWIFGGGAGAHIGLGEHFAIKIQLLALYYWYDETKVFGLPDSWFDDELDGDAVAFVDNDLKPCDEGEAGCSNYYTKSGDTKDKSGELFFPLITIGMAFFF